MEYIKEMEKMKNSLSDPADTNKAIPPLQQQQLFHHLLFQNPLSVPVWWLKRSERDCGAFCFNMVCQGRRENRLLFIDQTKSRCSEQQQHSRIQRERERKNWICLKRRKRLFEKNSCTLIIKLDFMMFFTFDNLRKSSFDSKITIIITWQMVRLKSDMIIFTCWQLQSSWILDRHGDDEDEVAAGP